MSTVPKADLRPVADKIRIATAALFNNSIFHASILSGMKLIPDPTLPTAATDCYTTIWFNETFFATLSPQAIATVLAHEVWHKAGLHAARCGSRDRQLWNVACDFRINKDLADQGFDFSAWPNTFTITRYKELLAGADVSPKDRDAIMLDSSLGDRSPEDIYDELTSALPPPTASGAGTPPTPMAGPMSGDVDYDALSSAAQAAGKTVDQVTSGVALDVAQALEAAKAIGQLPGSLARLAGMLETPKVDWRAVLKRAVLGSFGNPVVFGDYSYRRPSRRSTFEPGAPMLPSIVREPAEPIVVAVDTSGSIGDDELRVFATEIVGILRDVRPSKVIVVYCDAAVAGVEEFENYTDLVLEAKGGGGTAFKPVFDWVDENAPTAKVVVYLTDGYGSFSFQPPNREVVWGITTNVVPPWGTAVEVDLNG